MTTRTQSRILIAYAITGLVIFAGSLVLEYGPGWHRDPFTEQNLPRTGTEQVSSILFAMAPTALYAAFGLTAVRRTLNRGYISLGYATWGAIITLALTIGLGSFGDALGHIDCGDSCVASVPTYAEIARNHAFAWTITGLMSAGVLAASIVGRTRVRAALATPAE